MAPATTTADDRQRPRGTWTLDDLAVSDAKSSTVPNRGIPTRQLTDEHLSVGWGRTTTTGQAA